MLTSQSFASYYTEMEYLLRPEKFSIYFSAFSTSQEYYHLPEFNGMHPVLGGWIVAEINMANCSNIQMYFVCHFHSPSFNDDYIKLGADPLIWPRQGNSDFGR